MNNTNNHTITVAWATAWNEPLFRKQFFISLTVVVGILMTFPHFFKFIQDRSGQTLNDWILEQLPAYDVSLPVFLLIWGAGLLLLVRVLKDPQLLLMFLACYAVLTFSRFISITSLPLEPPPYLIPLADPLTNAFYGEKGYITKDLFFSGHTSTIFLISLCLKRPIDKYVILFVSIAIGFLCIIQHVHYTLDVVCAFPFTYLDWRIGKWLLERK